MYQPYDVPRSFKNEAHHRLIHYRLATSSTYGHMHEDSRWRRQPGKNRILLTHRRSLSVPARRRGVRI